MTDEDLVIEGLAAQLYNRSKDSPVWWHLLAESVKMDFRAQASKKIKNYKSILFDIVEETTGT